MDTINKLSAIIVDDENKSRENLSILLEDFCTEVKVVDKAMNVKDAVQKITVHEPDLVFLDIQLDSSTGFDVLKQVKDVDFDVIFTTAYSEYAIQAIRHAALDYLLKPINIPDLQQAVSKAYQRKDDSSIQLKMSALLQHLKGEDHSVSKIALPTSEGLKFIRVAEIIYMKAEGSYTNVFTDDAQKYLVSKNLKEYDNLQLTNNFFRIHHSYLINLDMVDKYIKGEGGQVVMLNGVQLDVSKRRKHLFLQRMEK